MDTFIINLLLVVTINNAILYCFWTKTHRIPYPNVQIAENGTDKDSQMPTGSGSCNTGEDDQATASEISAAHVPSHESTGNVPQDSDAPLSSDAPPPGTTQLIVSYHEIVAAVTRYVSG